MSEYGECGKYVCVRACVCACSCVNNVSMCVPVFVAYVLSMCMVTFEEDFEWRSIL